MVNMKEQDQYEYVVVVISCPTANAQNQPVFGLKVYGPYDTPREADESAKAIASIEYGSVLVRPLIDLGDLLSRRLSADS
jgi:hypothetical protein